MKTNKISASLEDYLEAIYQIIEKKQGVKAVEIARYLNVGRSSVTEALKNLANKGLVNYARYDVISLTEEGKKAALDVIFKHELLFGFFHNILSLTDEEANDNACKIEHVISEKAFLNLKKYVEFIENLKSQNKIFLTAFNDFIKNV